jgi:hypothetical protein
VSGEDERTAGTEDPPVERRCREPLHVQDVARAGDEARCPERVLEHLHRYPQPGAAEDARRDGVEGLAPPVAVGGVGRDPETERRGDELNVRSRPGQRDGKLVVVGRREAGRVGEDDAHQVRVSSHSRRRRVPSATLVDGVQPSSARTRPTSLT